MTLSTMLEINTVTEFQSSCTIAYQVKGHHDRALFQSSLESDYKLTCDTALIRHEYHRNVPQGNEGMIAVRCQKGRGAYPVTVLDVEDAKPIKESDRPC